MNSKIELVKILNDAKVAKKRVDIRIESENMNLDSARVMTLDNLYIDANKNYISIDDGSGYYHQEFDSINIYDSKLKMLLTTQFTTVTIAILN